MAAVTGRTIAGFGDPNPFVGPRPIQQGEALYGRASEVEDLYDRLQARRIVVLHSPSGAGKSSLVQAGLVPMLKAGHYDVWKPIRVNLDPAGFEGVPEGSNRYLLSAMISLEEELPPQHRRSPAQLVELDFLEYLDGRPRRKGKRGRSVALLFDQFEEVLTTAPRAVEAKREFFDAVGRALDVEKYWALFIIREDYLAALAPYRDRIPTHLANSVRLDLLGLEGAREAAEQLALAAGRTFPAVDQLVADLSAVQEMQPDGSYSPAQGMYVEPVQLQVVCRRLWGSMPEDATSIEAQDIERYADVSQSLAGYYADAVLTLAGDDVALERTLRDWVGQELIVGGHRSQVRQDTGTLAEFDDAFIGRLLDTYLVRSEQRAGANWFELSHDRLVEPVLEDNEAWGQAHLHPLQVQAKLWEDGGRARALLLGADALPDALSWADDYPELLTGGERDFLGLSRSLREEEARQRRRQRVFTAVLAAVALVALALGGVAWRMQLEANAKRLEAVAAKTDAERARSTAEASRAEAEAARDKAEKAQVKAEAAQTRAEKAQQTNERLVRDLLRQMFQVALQSFIETLAEGGVKSGEIEVDERWTSLLERKGRRFAAANVFEGGGRIVAAGHDAVLSEVDENGRSLFLEITVEWLLGDQARRGVTIITQEPERYGRLEALRRNLSALGYEYEIDPPLEGLASDEDVGVVIIDNRWWRSFTAEEIAAIEAFVHGGGGLLAVGGGWEWLNRDVAEGEPNPTLDGYPMNELLRRFGVRWSGETIDPAQLEGREDVAMVRFENEADHAVDLSSRSHEGREEYYTTLEPGEARALRTTLAQTWVARAAGDHRLIGECAIDARKVTVTIDRSVTSKKASPRPKAEPRPSPEATPKSKPTPARLPLTPAKAELDAALASAKSASRACGRTHDTLFSTVEVKFSVGPNGEVTGASALAPLKGTAVGTCVANVIAKQRFSKSQRGVSKTWSLPL